MIDSGTLCDVPYARKRIQQQGRTNAQEGNEFVMQSVDVNTLAIATHTEATHFRKRLIKCRDDHSILNIK